MAKPQSYWERRKARELYEELVKAEDTAEEMRQLYMASSRGIQEEAVKLARRFQLRHNLSVKEAERLLARSLDPGDIKNLIQMLKQDPGNAELAAELESQAYASRINRLMAVQNSVDAVANEIYRRSNAATTAVLQDIGESMYYKQLFEMQQRAGAAFGFTPLDPDRLLGIINRRWSGQNFSERLWTNREQLAAEVKRQLLLGILTGRANRKMAQEIDGRFSVSYNNTRRLVRTEANYVANQLQVESYKDTGVDKYIYVAILDLRTSEICRDLDKKRFLVSNAIVGENYPPMHPWCRSTTIAWMPDQLLKKLQQSAIDPATGETITVPGDMTYQEWYDKYVLKEPEKPASLARDLLATPERLGSSRGPITGYRIDAAGLQKKIDEVGKEFAQTKYKDTFSRYNGSTKGDDYREASEWLNAKLGADSLPKDYDPDRVRPVIIHRAKPNNKRSEAIWRGVGGNPSRRNLSSSQALTPSQMVKEYKDGAFFAGTGIYGDGTYGTPRKMIADHYAGKKGAVFDIYLDKDARVIEFEDLKRIGLRIKYGTIKVDDPYSLLDNISAPDGSGSRNGALGRLANMLGFDAIKKADGDGLGEDFYVILNRGATMVKR